VAERLGRKWLGADAGAFAVQTTRKRLLRLRRDRENPPPFALLDCAPDAPPPGRPLTVRLRDQVFTYAPPEIRAGIRTDGAGFSVELCGFLVADGPEEGGLTVRRGLLHRREAGKLAPLMRSWQDWVDSWDLGPAPADGGFVSLWQALRERGSRELPLRAPVPPGETRALAVRVVDIFAHEHTIILP
jgi:hypothetical protein